MSAKSKQVRRVRRKKHIRKKVFGTGERPRLAVYRSLKHIYVQAIDDVKGVTIAHASSLNDEVVAGLLGAESVGRVPVGFAVGQAVARRLKERNVAGVVFDRSGYLYHGRVKAVADGVRQEGIVV